MTMRHLLNNAINILDNVEINSGLHGCLALNETTSSVNKVVHGSDFMDMVYTLKKETLKELPNIGDIEKTLFPDYAKKEKLSTIKFRNLKWYSIDSFKDMEECSLVIEKIIK